MPDIFDQLANQASLIPSTRPAATADIFDRLAGTEQEPAFQAKTLPTVTAENHLKHAADYIGSLTREGRRVNALARQAIVDQFRVQAGLEPLLGKDHYQAALNKRNEENPFFSFAAGVNRGLARTGTSLLGTVAPETAAGLQQGVEATTGEDYGAAGAAGRLLAGGATAAATLPLGGVGMAASFGAQGFGGTRADVARRRTEGAEISSAQEFGAAILTGGVEALSGLVTQRVAAGLGPKLSGLAPGFRAALQRGGGQGARSFLIQKATPLLVAAGIEGAEEAAAQFANNVIAKQMKIDPDRGITLGLVEAGIGGAVLSPFLGGVAGKIQSSTTASTEQHMLAAAATKRKQTPPATETLAQQVSRLEGELAEERRLARTDPLTELPNRRGFEELEQEAFDAADAVGESVAVVETDLANFKVLNDKLGHEVGDRVLVAEAEAIREAVREETEGRPGDLSAGDVGRVGGDEFPVRLRRIDDPVLAEKVMKRANEIFAAKVAEIVGDDLPEQARPFIAWGVEIRKAGDPRTRKELIEAAEQKVIPVKDRIKAERGIPTDREGLTKFVAEYERTRAQQQQAAQDVSEFTPGQVLEAIGQQDTPDADVLADVVGDENYVLVDAPLEVFDPAFAADEDLSPTKLDRSREGLIAGTPAPPITADANGIVIDGRHRLLAAAEAGQSTVAAFLPRSTAEAKGLVQTAQADVVQDQSDTATRATRKPNPRVREQAAAYIEQAGLPKPAASKYAKVDVPRAERIARLYEEMEHDPADPETREAYEAFKRETLAQWEFLVEQGVVFEPWPADAEQAQPYANSAEMMADVEQGHLWFFTGGDLPSDHPLAEPAGIEVGGQELTVNDVFRAVHDYFGHSKEGNGFGPRGEENAWLEHSQMYSAVARRAMTTETRGQDSWVNYGPLGEQNRANPAETTYADQKAGLLPPWVSDPAPDAGSPRRTTSARKAQMRHDRLALGLSDLDDPDVRGWSEALRVARGDGVPLRALSLATSVVANPRALTDVETAGIVQAAATLKNDHARLTEELKTAEGPAAASRAEELARIEQDFEMLSRALRRSGTEKGRALAAQKLTIDQDFDLVSVLTRARAAKMAAPGSDPEAALSPKQREQFERLVSQLEAAEKRLREARRNRPKGDTQETPEVARRIFERDRARREIIRRIHALRPRSIFERAVAEPFNLFRALITSFDFSAVFRQGGFIALGHPLRAAKAMKGMFQSAWSAKADARINRAIHERPNGALYEQAGLYLAPAEGDPVRLTEREEHFQTSLADRIPLVRHSQRAYTTFLNLLRADSFDAMVAGLARNGQPTRAEARAIANFINAATGRGRLGSMEPAAVVLNTIFFAPRYVASRFQILAGQPLYSGTAATRQMIAREYARYLIGVGFVYMLSSLFDDEEDDTAKIEFDPRSSDFGKIRIGNTRLDPLSGLSQVTVLLSRTATGKTKPLAGGDLLPLRGEGQAFGSSVPGVIGRFLRTKLSPMFGTAVDVLAGENVIGEKTTTGSVATGLLIPMSFREIADAIKEQGVTEGAALGLASIFGFGLQSFELSEAARRKAARSEALAAARQGDYRKALDIIERWNARRVETGPLTMQSLGTSLQLERRKAALKENE